MRRSDELPNLDAQEAPVARDPWHRPRRRLPDQGAGRRTCSATPATARWASRRCVRPPGRIRWSCRGSSRPPATWPTPTSGATGNPIPVYTSTGPGPMLLTVAMGNAFYDSSAFVAITGQVATNQFDCGALQEEYRHHRPTSPASSSRSSSAACRPTASRTWRSSSRRPSRSRATGRPGPVHIDVPYDLWIRTGRRRDVPEPRSARGC